MTGFNHFDVQVRRRDSIHPSIAFTENLLQSRPLIRVLGPAENKTNEAPPPPSTPSSQNFDLGEGIDNKHKANREKHSDQDKC